MIYLDINRKQFTKLMIDYGFARFPRAIGKPDQHIIHDFDSFIFFFKYNYGKRPMFTSTNSYWDFNEIGNPTNVYYEKLFFDLDIDTGYTTEEAHKETIKMADFCRGHKIPFTSSFSGMGFHFFIFFKPKILTLDGNLSRSVKGVANYMKEELKLKTINMVCAEPKRLVRIPLSKYVTKKEGDGEWTKTNRNCIPLTYNQLSSMNTDEIRNLSNNFKILDESYKFDGNKIQLKDFIKDFKVDVNRKVIISTREGVVIENEVEYNEFKDEEIYKIVQLLVPFPCLSKHIFDKNPPHFVRFSVCAFLSHNNILSKEESYSFFDKISMVAEWNDRQHTMTRKYQIDNIYNNPEYDRYSCENIQSSGYCIGKKCKFYERYLKQYTLVNEEDGKEIKV